MDAAQVAIAAIALAATSGVPGWFDRTRGGSLAAVMLGMSGLLAVVAAILGLAHPATLGAASTAAVAGWHGSLQVDALSAVFLIATGIVSGAAGLFGAGYWRDHEQSAAPWTRIFIGLLVAGILGVFVAGDALTFLIAWEIMALAGFALVATHHQTPATREAAYIFLISTRTATLALIIAFVLLAHLTGSLGWNRLPAAVLSTGPGIAMLLLFALGFGLKAGAVPFHFWLPPAHAAAPSHASAIMSGVLIKTGIYGLCRLSSLMDAPPLWWGAGIFLAGAVSAVLGVTWALGSHDLKRLLAYHSVENIGIILLGLGLALVGRSLDMPILVVFGLAGGLLHVLNHALFKSLLFLGAGAVDHACHTRTIDRLGGLGRRMPVTSACFLVGAAAICALPPFNGFLSEWLVYLGLFNGAILGWHWAVGGLVALVLTGGLALACFAKAAGIVFLGEPRSPQAAQAHETGLPERSAMILLAALCLGIGLSLPLLAPGLARAVQAAAPGISATLVTTTLTQGSAGWLSAGAGAIILGGMALWWWQRRRLVAPASAGTWDCGYAEPTARMQYTATSFAAPLTSELYAVMLPERHLPELSEGTGVPSTAERLFPSAAAFADHPRDPVLERLLHPLGNAAAWCCRQARVAHPGWVHLYLLYLAVTCILLLIWSLA